MIAPEIACKAYEYNNAQPHYCLVDHQGNLLVKPKNCDLKAANFAAFLDSGKEAFGK